MPRSSSSSSSSPRATTTARPPLRLSSSPRFTTDIPFSKNKNSFLYFFFFLSFFPLFLFLSPSRLSKLAGSNARYSRTTAGNYFLVIFHRATSTNRATRRLIIAAKMILSMDPASPHREPCDYNANAKYAGSRRTLQHRKLEEARARKGHAPDRGNRFLRNC